MVPPPLKIDDLADPQELLDLWAFDSWLCYIDRVAEGNILLTLGEAAKFHLIAADQSDCFGGAARFASGEWKQILETKDAQCVEFLDRAILDVGGATALEKSAKKVRTAAGHTRQAISSVPREWWDEAKIDRMELERVIQNRSDRSR